MDGTARDNRFRTHLHLLQRAAADVETYNGGPAGMAQPHAIARLCNTLGYLAQAVGHTGACLDISSRHPNTDMTEGAEVMCLWGGVGTLAQGAEAAYLHSQRDDMIALAGALCGAVEILERMNERAAQHVQERMRQAPPAATVEQTRTV